MKNYDAKHIKNIAILGSSKSGKTTLAETMVFEAGLIKRRGTVEDHNTISDFHDIEHERNGSVYTSVLHTEWRNYKINILDTPGYTDFIGDILTSLKVSDTSVILINAQHGVEVDTDNIWEYIEEYRKPIIFAVNQLDHQNADFRESFVATRRHYGPAVTMMQYPPETGEGFNKIIDLLKMKMYVFGPDGGKPEKHEIPEEEMEKATRLHNELVEKAAENDDTLMELFFEKGTLTESEMRKGIKLGMYSHDIFPVFCLSGLNNMGSGRLMGFIDNVAPSTVDMWGENDREGNEIKPTTDGPTELFVFKTHYEENLGKLVYFKVISGKVNVGDTLVNHQTEEEEHLKQLFVMKGSKRIPVDSLSTGDIGATIKLKGTQTNHTLCQKGHDVGIEAIKFPEPKIRTAINVASKEDDDKLSKVLKKIHEEDPTIDVRYSKELGQTIISCQGSLQLNLLKWALDNKYKIKATYEKPKIPYRETIQKQTSVSYKHKKQSGGSGQFAEVHFVVEPWYEGMPKHPTYPERGKETIDLEWGGKLEFVNSIVGGVIDVRYLPAILKGLMEVMENGPLTGSYVRDVRVTVFDGKMHDVDSNEISFKLAAVHAFRNAFELTNPKLMEPIYEVEVKVPENFMGEVMTEIQSRRAIISGIEAKGHFQIIKADMPLAEMSGFYTSLRSVSHGRANYKRTFKEYAATPHDVQQQIIKEYKENKEA